MKRPGRILLAVAALSSAMIWRATTADAQTEEGTGFVLRSNNFGTPCVGALNDIPIVYDNLTDKSVEVSVKVVNTGQAILFISNSSGAEYAVIPPFGPQRRPRVMRIRLGPNEHVGIRADTSQPCSWFAVIQPH